MHRGIGLRSRTRVQTASLPRAGGGKVALISATFSAAFPAAWLFVVRASTSMFGLRRPLTDFPAFWRAIGPKATSTPPWPSLGAPQRCPCAPRGLSESTATQEAQDGRNGCVRSLTAYRAFSRWWAPVRPQSTRALQQRVCGLTVSSAGKRPLTGRGAPASRAAQWWRGLSRQD